MSRWQGFCVVAMFGFVIGAVICFVYAWYGGMAGCIGGAYGAMLFGYALEGERDA